MATVNIFGKVICKCIICEHVWVSEFNDGNLPNRCGNRKSRHRHWNEEVEIKKPVYTDRIVIKAKSKDMIQVIPLPERVIDRDDPVNYPIQRHDVMVCKCSQCAVTRKKMKIK